MPREYKLSPLSILLRFHSIPELKHLYEIIEGEKLSEPMSHADLVKYISDKTTIDRVLEEWDSKLYAHTTTLKIYQLLDADGSAYQESKKFVRSNFSEKGWDRLTGGGLSPSEIPEDGQVIHIASAGEKYYFLFVLPGRPKEVLENLTVRYLLQPAFALAMLDTRKGSLQVRGHEPREVVALKISKFIQGGGGDKPILARKKIQDMDGANSLKTALSGKLHRARMTHDTDEIADITMTSQPSIELSRTQKYRTYVDEGFDLNSVGIDFDYSKKHYTLWVGLTTGTFWIRSGDVTEDLLQYVQRTVLNL